MGADSIIYSSNYIIIFFINKPTFSKLKSVVGRDANSSAELMRESQKSACGKTKFLIIY
jgi:hypothetical protein